MILMQSQRSRNREALHTSQNYALPVKWGKIVQALINILDTTIMIKLSGGDRLRKLKDRIQGYGSQGD